MRFYFLTFIKESLNNFSYCTAVTRKFELKSKTFIHSLLHVKLANSEIALSSIKNAQS